MAACHSNLSTHRVAPPREKNMASVTVVLPTCDSLTRDKNIVRNKETILSEWTSTELGTLVLTVLGTLVLTVLARLNTTTTTVTTTCGLGGPTGAEGPVKYYFIQHIKYGIYIYKTYFTKSVAVGNFLFFSLWSPTLYFHEALFVCLPSWRWGWWSPTCWEQLVQPFTCSKACRLLHQSQYTLHQRSQACVHGPREMRRRLWTTDSAAPLTEPLLVYCHWLLGQWVCSSWWTWGGCGRCYAGSWPGARGVELDHIAADWGRRRTSRFNDQVQLVTLLETCSWCY